MAHGHWTVERVKMSKSIGNVVDPMALHQRYGVDPVRYFLLRDGSLGADGDFSEDTLVARLNAELADTLGNLLSRCTASALLLPGRVVPTPLLPLPDGSEAELVRCLEALPVSVGGYYDALDFAAALKEIQAALAMTNRFFSDQEPWRFKRSPPGSQERQRLCSVLYVTQEAVRIAGVLLQPIIPASADSLLSALGVPPGQRTAGHGRFGRQVNSLCICACLYGTYTTLCAILLCLSTSLARNDREVRFCL